MSGTPTPTPTGLENASVDMASSFGPAWGLGGLVVIGLYIIGALLAAQFVAPWLAQSTVLGAVGDKLLSALSYAIKGVAASAVLAVVALPGYLLLTVDASTRGMALQWVGYGLSAFVGLVVVGWLADCAVARYINAHPSVDSWAELWETDDEAPEVAADGGEQA